MGTCGAVAALLNGSLRPHAVLQACLGIFGVLTLHKKIISVYLIFLALSIVVDFVWLAVWGRYITSYLDVVEFTYSAQKKVGFVNIVWALLLISIRVDTRAMNVAFW